MKIIISPAKKMTKDTDSLPWRELPEFLPRTVELLERLRGMSYSELKALWRCSDALAEMNAKRLEHMDLYRELTPAILAYEGIQYQHMAPGVFTDLAMEYVQRNLCILSGFYGLLRPFDGVTPYRLEMQAKLPIGGFEDLYGFWGYSLMRWITSETDCIVNLASKEYSMCVSRYLPENYSFITISFAEQKQGKLMEKGTLCKMARGEMVRFLAENSIENPEDMKAFSALGYQFAPEYSDGNRFTFLREGEQ